MGNKYKVLVLAGGLSEERQVSLASAKAITESLIRLEYEVNVIDSATGQSLLDSGRRYLYEKDSGSDSTMVLKQPAEITLMESINSKPYKDVDVIFLALHGGAGENGTIQALLDLAGKKYTGSSVLASAVAMNKAFAKRLLRNENVPTPNWLLLKIGNKSEIANYLPVISKKFAPPIIVKPNNSGSTVGLTLVKGFSDLAPAVEKAFEAANEVLIEEYIKGREITAAIFNGKALPLVEIIPSHELYDYQCKYTKGKSQYICPAEIPEMAAKEIRELAMKAYEIIGCSGLVRADFILDSNSHPYFLEINTLPGMTELSLAPLAAKQAGISFDQLIEKICESALDK
ncbi:MAG: D-alanine--D-alanine ligase [candidate division Zixibacteria bacterium]|nr:D-alanine--D-alanine ligase [candidate division Zixibacteria bacterium]